MMNYYFAPMEGVTGYIYRNAQFKYFEPADKYFTPFITPTQNGRLSSREISDILPEHNKGLVLVPQILTNRADYFLGTAETLKEYGYKELNINLGCPSRTVVTKNKGAGFLAKREELLRFFDAIFEHADIRISVKTRIGKDDPEEFEELLRIFNRFPLEELIIHPRIQKDFYNGKPNRVVFAEAVKTSENKLCYNGDLFTVKDTEEFLEGFPQISTLMFGRGLIANPGLLGEIKGRQTMDKKIFSQFHEAVLEGYAGATSGDRNLLFKMKELWLYMGAMFPDSEKLMKKIKKTDHLWEYNEAVKDLLEQREIIAGDGYKPKG